MDYIPVHTLRYRTTLSSCVLLYPNNRIEQHAPTSAGIGRGGEAIASVTTIHASSDTSCGQRDVQDSVPAVHLEARADSVVILIFAKQRSNLRGVANLGKAGSSIGAALILVWDPSSLLLALKLRLLSATCADDHSLPPGLHPIRTAPNQC